MGPCVRRKEESVLQQMCVCAREGVMGSGVGCLVRGSKKREFLTCIFEEGQIQGPEPIRGPRNC